MDCPFLCGFHTPSDVHAEYQITAHIELHHTPESEFAVDDKDLEFALALQREEEQVFVDGGNRDTPTKPSSEDCGAEKESAATLTYDDFPYVECPKCEDFVHLIELDEHMNNHLSLHYSSDTIAGDMAGVNFGHDTNFCQSSAPLQCSTTIARPLNQHHKGNLAETRPKTIRLGKKELGPYAFENRMPESLLKRLQNGEATRRINRITRDGQIHTDRIVDNEVPGLVPVIARLCIASSTHIEKVHLCHPSVQYVHKGTNPGHFCGYRNIQMLVSFIQGTKARDHERFGKSLPGVLQIQDLIENAWDHDPNNLGRQETGGIRNTRKWIGTPEAQSICKHLNIDHSVHTFSNTQAGRAHEHLLDFVEDYFSRDAEGLGFKVHKSHRPPIYLQQPGHSMTIIGIERHANGKRSLLIFDPGFGPPKQLVNMVTGPSSSAVSAKTADRLLRPHKRTIAQLARYDEFEVLT
ncbi:DUF1671-domain-containing protein [Aureobasidium sp. EXF-10727]|nr:DUF1671-domain-containing protein [Aureobasidium sp. EXF-10727]KAI4729689.1 DUF1671-domain-containing protein [Aureobasidium sp. EXF-10728]